jgi:glutamine synthetase
MQTWQQLYDDFGIKAICAIEIEWYLLQDGNPAPDELRQQYLERLQPLTSNLPLVSTECERGAGQVEASTLPTHDMAMLVSATERLKQQAKILADDMAAQACFAAKPFTDSYGNGLHVHVHLEKSGEKLFWVEDEAISSHLGWAIAGLLQHMQADLAIFAGDAASLQRYQAGFNAPINVSWGFNNRTTALRLPDNNGHLTGLDAILQMRQSPNSRRYKRIEHRVPSANASIEATLNAILHAIYNGIKQQLPPPPPVHGNAYDYDLDLFITNPRVSF